MRDMRANAADRTLTAQSCPERWRNFRIILAELVLVQHEDSDGSIRSHAFAELRLGRQAGVDDIGRVAVRVVLMGHIDRRANRRSLRYLVRIAETPEIGRVIEGRIVRIPAVLRTGADANTAPVARTD